MPPMPKPTTIVAAAVTGINTLPQVHASDRGNPSSCDRVPGWPDLRGRRSIVYSQSPGEFAPQSDCSHYEVSPKACPEC